MTISKLMQRAMILMSLAGLVLLSACAESDDDFDLKTGHFYDSAVKNLKYKTATGDGTTDEKGTFWYIEGEDITFSVGNLAIGATVKAKSIMTPVDLVPEATYANYDIKEVKDIAHFLQRLDTNQNPDDGIIEICDKVHEELEEDAKSWHMGLTSVALKELSDAKVITPYTRTPDDALNHLKIQINELKINDPDEA